MTPLQNLHSAIGELAYAMACIDGKVQEKEREKFHDIIAAELRYKHYDFDISDIIFQILDKDHSNAKTVYQWAIKEIRLNSHYLSPELKACFIKIMEKIAEAYPSVTNEEKQLLAQFKEDIAPLKGDPVYYSHHS